MKQMNVTLTKEACEIVQKLIDTGHFSSQSEVIRAAIFCFDNYTFEKEQKAEAWKQLNQKLKEADKTSNSNLTMDDILESHPLSGTTSIPPHLC